MLRAVANMPLYIGAMAFANLPPASTATNLMATATDLGANGTLVCSNGTRWRPCSGTSTLKDKGAPQAAIANSETIVVQTLLPINALQVNDTLRIWCTLNKSGTTDSCNVTMRVGAAGTTSDTAIMTAVTMLAAANISGGFVYDFKLLTATSLQRIGTIGGISAYGTAGANAVPAGVTITDASVNALYVSLSIASSGASNTVGIQGGQIQLITP